MDRTQWPQGEIQKAAAASGKPLEVETALAFLAEGWTPELSSYFDDLRGPRELDVMVTMEVPLLGSGIRARLRALVSCKGFKPEDSPLTYSLSNREIAGAPPCLLSERRARQKVNGSTTEEIGDMLDIEKDGATWVLRNTALRAERPIVAFDTVKRSEKVKGGKPTGETSYDLGGDRPLSDGLDSALRAALFWKWQDRQDGEQHYTLYVPILVLASRWWDTCIDGGQVAGPVLRACGYQTSRYPHERRMVNTMVIVWSREELPALVQDLRKLFNWFGHECQSRSGPRDLT